MYRAKKAGPGGYAFCSEIVEGTAPRASLGRRRDSRPAKRPDSPLAEHEARLRELLEANKHLVSAAQTAQKLQANAEDSAPPADQLRRDGGARAAQPAVGDPHGGGDAPASEADDDAMRAAQHDVIQRQARTRHA